MSGDSRKLRERTDKSESKFDRLRRLRATGESALALLPDEGSSSDDAMYMNVDEEDYRSSSKHRASRLDDFVVNDTPDYDSSDDIGGRTTDSTFKKQTKLGKPAKTKGKPAASAAAAAPAAVAARGASLSTMFKNAHLRTAKAPATRQEDEAFMESLISGLEAPLTPSKRAAGGKRRPLGQSPKVTGSSSSGRIKNAGFIDDPFAMPLVQAQARPAKRPRPEMMAVDSDGPAAAPESDAEADVVVKREPGVGYGDDDNGNGNDGDADLAALAQLDDDELLGGLDTLDTLDTADVKPLPAPLYTEADTAPQGTDWTDVHLPLLPSEPIKTEDPPAPAAAAAQNAGSTSDVLVYWLDASETRGTVYLFGKTMSRENPGVFESCCVCVSGIERNVFLLPAVRDAQTGERFGAMDVHGEVEALAVSHGVRQFACKPVERKYAFEEPSVPAAAEYLKVVYGFSQPALPADLRGRTFSHTFGTSYSALELLLLKRRMMGPGWLRLSGARLVPSDDHVSWCRREYAVADPKTVRALDDEQVAQLQLPRTPPLTTLTLSLRTAANAAGANEVVAASLLVHRGVALDDTRPADQRAAQQLVLVRPPPGIPMPADFARLQRANERQRLDILVERTEASLLNLLMAQLKLVDPDVLTAHNFYGFDLDVLLHRMQAQRTRNWSVLGRLRRFTMPKLGPSDASYAARQMVAGRVVCDTYLAAKDLVRARSYSLGSLAMQELSIRREDMPFDRTAEYFGDAHALLRFLRHTAFDAFLAAALAIRLQALPLTRQLTQLAGNLWSRTLMGARAERNEFLLLHEFYRGRFIRPDRAAFGYAAKPGRPSLQAEMAQAADQQPDDADAEDEGQTAAAAAAAQPAKSGRRKPAYLGGLVLEPKRGFYDRFVLLLDFNSLNTTIIQEFNICFTTVRRTSAADDLPELPPPSAPPGILPKLLKNLVDRRRQVKQMLRKPGIAAEEAAQLNVRQQALKLTANSMYGCLGFTHSRFYAKPLAMLITSRGREILQATRDLALADGLEVIYGDTDSLMIATRCATLAEAYDLGAQFKRHANERYRLLELDIDGVFKRLLLLKKKKYAALQIVDPEKHRQGEAYQTRLESKGLDLVRRDWCELSHEVSAFVLQRLFADPRQGEEDDTAAITEIHEHLEKVARAVRAQQVPLDRYAIHKGLTKPPEQYADKKSQPHVLVALRLRQKGHTVRSGDTVPYIICDAQCPGIIAAAAEEGNRGSSYAERARHPDEIRDSQGALYPDIEWYLNQQVLPPCGRLLDPLDGTDMATLAQHLGLDAARFRHAASVSASAASAYDPEALRTLDSQIPDAERFKHAQPLTPTCPACKAQYAFDGIARKPATSPSSSSLGNSAAVGLQSGLVCAHCGHLPSLPLLATQLTLAIRRHIREYYAFTRVCDEPSCALTTRVLSVNAAKCLRPHCSGTLHEVYSDKMLYHQLLYFAALLNIDRSATRLECTSADVKALRDTHIEYISRLALIVDTYLSVSARRFVDLTSLFSFCRI
ncbi:DNA-directed DNA polymerase alpha catalytic subunit pol1 [Coemansia erecta]|uniref:DNA polymerase n=1 Tax=Coemansia erecta TaxID=147472 RepID=A0A9W7XWF0_9FUNG|nr:DNA-directed DNA polymerase alpha catalytic subunit pol1 [Coemansia erecta]